MSFVTIRDVMASSAGSVMGAVIAALAAVKKELWKREGRDSAKANEYLSMTIIISLDAFSCDVKLPWPELVANLVGHSFHICV